MQVGFGQSLLVISDVQRVVRHPTVRWMGATLDGRVEGSGAVFESKFMLPWSFSEEAAAEKYMPQLQHNMWVVAAKTAVLSVITGGGKWVEINTHADPLYQHLGEFRPSVGRVHVDNANRLDAQLWRLDSKKE